MSKEAIFLKKPMTKKVNMFGENDIVRYGSCSMQGWRSQMEDEVVALTNLYHKLPGHSFFAVFDGHCGRDIARLCSRELLDRILNTAEFRSGNYENGIIMGFLGTDRCLKMRCGQQVKGGSTVVCSFISNEKIIIANCGDSRAVLCRNHQVFFETEDHKPSVERERMRINRAGCFVRNNRVNGKLGVSRALGDFYLKNFEQVSQSEQPVSPMPDVLLLERSEYDNFLVLACDGIFDVISSQQICQYILNRLQITKNLIQIANEIVDACLSKGSTDNMTLLIITFPGAPKLCFEAIIADKEFEEELTNTVKKELEHDPNLNFKELVQVLNGTPIEGTPPGVGLDAKMKVIFKAFQNIQSACRQMTEK